MDKENWPPRSTITLKRRGAASASSSHDPAQQGQLLSTYSRKRPIRTMQSAPTALLEHGIFQRATQIAPANVRNALGATCQQECANTLPWSAAMPPTIVGLASRCASRPSPVEGRFVKSRLPPAAADFRPLPFADLLPPAQAAEKIQAEKSVGVKRSESTPTRARAQRADFTSLKSILKAPMKNAGHAVPLASAQHTGRVQFKSPGSLKQVKTITPVAGETKRVASLALARRTKTAMPEPAIIPILPSQRQYADFQNAHLCASPPTMVCAAFQSPPTPTVGQVTPTSDTTVDFLILPIHTPEKAAPLAMSPAIVSPNVFDTSAGRDFLCQFDADNSKVWRSPTAPPAVFKVSPTRKDGGGGDDGDGRDSCDNADDDDVFSRSICRRARFGMRSTGLARTNHDDIESSSSSREEVFEDVFFK